MSLQQDWDYVLRWGQLSAYLAILHHQILDAIDHTGTFASERHAVCCLWQCQHTGDQFSADRRAQY